jgi:Tol biopolymer transport system component
VIVVATGVEEKPLQILNLDGTIRRTITAGERDKPKSPPERFLPMRLSVSPTGQHVIADELDGISGHGGFTAMPITILDLNENSPRRKTLTSEAYWARTAWSADGKGVYISQIDPAKMRQSDVNGNAVLYQTSLFDIDTGISKAINLPSEHAILDVSPDGSTAITVSHVNGPGTRSLHLIPFATMKPETICEKTQSALLCPRFSPDGKKILGIGSFTNPQPGQSKDLYVYEISSKTESRIELSKDIAKAERIIRYSAWSPDGKRIATAWVEEIPKPAKPRSYLYSSTFAVPGKWFADRITICDLDGSNTSTVYRADDNDQIGGIHWLAGTAPQAPAR